MVWFAVSVFGWLVFGILALMVFGRVKTTAGVPEPDWTPKPLHVARAIRPKD
jgi:hypothetical protein